MNSIKYNRIVQAAIEAPWSILPAKLAIIQDILTFRASGGELTEEEIEKRLDGEEKHNKAVKMYYAAKNTGNVVSPSTNMATVAIIPLIGTIIPRADMFEESSGAVSIQKFQQTFREMVNDDQVDSIIIDVDSPGGQVSGVQEMADEIFQSRGKKPIIAIANSLAASAAYWLASAADEIIVTPSSEVGSIGVFAMHQDLSQMLDKAGVKVSLISSGKYKTEGNPFEPLNDEARGAIQSRVAEYYESFVSGVAQNRGVKYHEVINGFGQGRVVGAIDAVKFGMADRVGTLDDAINYALALASVDDKSDKKDKLLSSTGNKKLSDATEMTTVDSSSVYQINSIDETSKKGGTPMPEETKEVMATAQPTQPEIQALTLPDGTKVTASDIQALMATVNESRQKAKQADIQRTIDAAKLRGVAPAVLRIAEAVLDKADPEAQAVVKLDEQEVNMFGAVTKLLQIIPGKEMNETTEVDEGKKPAAVKQENVEMTLEQAEEEARQARQRLNITSPQQIVLAS